MDVIIGYTIAMLIIFLPWFLIAWKKGSGLWMAVAAELFVVLECTFLFGALVGIIVGLSIGITAAIVKRRY